MAKIENIEISEQVLNWINEETHRLSLEEKSTKQVAANAAVGLETKITTKK